MTLASASDDRGAVLMVRQARVRLSAANDPRTLTLENRATLSSVLQDDAEQLNGLGRTINHADWKCIRQTLLDWRGSNTTCMLKIEANLLLAIQASNLKTDHVMRVKLFE